MVCGKENETKYYKLNCILGKCNMKCQITDILKDLQPKITNIDKLLNYYMFELVETQYYNKKGQLQSYSRTIGPLLGKTTYPAQHDYSKSKKWGKEACLSPVR